MLPHHRWLFDPDVLGLTEALRVKVSQRFVGSGATVHAQGHELARRP